MRERHMRLRHVACSPEAVVSNFGGTLLRHLLHWVHLKVVKQTVLPGVDVLRPQADMVAFKAAIQARLFRKALELAYDVKRVTEN
jgi:hypothetical protein